MEVMATTKLKVVMQREWVRQKEKHKQRQGWNRPYDVVSQYSQDRVWVQTRHKGRWWKMRLETQVGTQW